MAIHKENIEYLKALAFLHCETLGRTETLRFTQEDQGQISVLLDTGVIHAFLLPQFEGPLQSDRRKRPKFLGQGLGGLGQLLPRLPPSFLQDEAGAQGKSPVEIRHDEDILA